MSFAFEMQNADTVRIIGLALTPVFLVSALGVLLNVLTGRVARLADRARRVEEEPGERTAGELRMLAGLAGRTVALYASIALTLLGMGLAALIVLLLFANTFIATDLSQEVEVCFLLAGVALVLALALFFAEVAASFLQLRRRRTELLAAAERAGTELSLAAGAPSRRRASGWDS